MQYKCINAHIYWIFIESFHLLFLSGLILADLPRLTGLVNHPHNINGDTFVPSNTSLTQHLFKCPQRKRARHTMSKGGDSAACQMEFYRTGGEPSDVCQVKKSSNGKWFFFLLHLPQKFSMVLNLDGFLTRFLCTQKCLWSPICASYEIIGSENVYSYWVEKANQPLLNST